MELILEECIITDTNMSEKNTINWNSKQQDQQALLKAKYCPRVAAASCTQKNTKNPCDLDLWPMTLKFNRVRAVDKGTCASKISSS